MKLVIVESPTKTKSLSKYLGEGYEILATMGHVRDLPKSKMGINIKAKNERQSRKAGSSSTRKAKNEYEFEPEYEAVEGKAEAIKKLTTVAKKAEKIILASDPDREGEAIAWHTMQVLRQKDAPQSGVFASSKGRKQGVKIGVENFERVVFHSITKEAILAAMKTPRKVDMNLVDAQQARRVLDRLVGYELSPVLWKKIRRGLSAGRVQSVAVRLVVEREKEIGVFKPEEYWEIKVQVGRQKAEGRSGDAFEINLVKINGRAAEIKDETRARGVVVDLEAANYEVERVEKKERRLYPHPPFKTSTLQQAAANVLGWSAKKTMSVAQRLYEKGLITYHRTDSLHLVGESVAQIREVIKTQFGAEYLPKEGAYYKTSGKVVAQEAHEAIRPTDVSIKAEGIRQNEEVDKDEEKLYELVWRRVVACQMVPALVDQTVIWVMAKNGESYQLRAVGETVKFASWKKLYKETEETILPEVKEKEKLTKEKVESEQKFTQPPARYNDASLIKELEKRGIGRPSTYAPTISTILERGYIEKKEKRFYATDVGVVVTEFLVGNFAKELDYEFTAKMEADLDEIAEGKQDWQKVLSDFYGPFEKTVVKVTKEAQRVKVPVESTGKSCPECKDGEIVIRSGRFGKFYSCSRFPECKYTAKLIQYVEGVVCPKDGGRVVVKRTKTGREFFGCENYPKCDHASWSRPTPQTTYAGGQATPTVTQSGGQATPTVTQSGGQATLQAAPET